LSETASDKGHAFLRRDVQRDEGGSVTLTVVELLNESLDLPDLNVAVFALKSESGRVELLYHVYVVGNFIIL